VDAQFDGRAQPTGAPLISPEKRVPRVRGADVPGHVLFMFERAGWKRRSAVANDLRVELSTEGTASDDRRENMNAQGPIGLSVMET
jgi:hypothetical protein